MIDMIRKDINSIPFNKLLFKKNKIERDPMKSAIFLVYLTLISLSHSSSYLEEIDLGDIPIPPDFGLDTEQLCQKYKYPFESHHVTTKDGYILGVHRIPHRKTNKFLEDDKKPPILMVHGILSSSTDWVTTGPNKSLAFQLADAGYDIWLMNMRGSTWSRNHTDLDPDTDRKFWEFSFNEVGLYDVPATIDHILNVTGAKNLTYVGFSEGTSASFAMTSTNTTYNEKLNLVVALAPVAYMKDVQGPILKLAKQYELPLNIIVNLLNLTEIPHIGLIKELGLILCNDESGIQELCADFIFLLTGEDKEQLNNSFIPVFFSNFPNAGSFRSLQHYLQFIETENFRMYDYGVIENRERYGSLFPPDYNISNIAAPVALYHGANDFFSSVPDVERLAKQLPNLAENKLVDWKKFNHIDFLLAIDVNELLYNQVIKIINKYNNK